MIYQQVGLVLPCYRVTLEHLCIKVLDMDSFPGKVSLEMGKVGGELPIVGELLLQLVHKVLCFLQKVLPVLSQVEQILVECTAGITEAFSFPWAECEGRGAVWLFEITHIDNVPDSIDIVSLVLGTVAYRLMSPARGFSAYKDVVSTFL
jgi:hypothetical protein